MRRGGENHQLVGKRVRVVRCNDEWSELEPGTEGTVSNVDDAGTVHVNWDTGSRLGLIPGVDEYELVTVNVCRECGVECASACSQHPRAGVNTYKG